MGCKRLPLIYACSGCSDAAQLANNVAVALDREGYLEMSCIAGVGGQVNPLVRKARSGRPIIAVDGCQLHCTVSCLRTINVEPTFHMRLYDHGFKKYADGLYDNAAIECAKNQVLTFLHSSCSESQN